MNNRRPQNATHISIAGEITPATRILVVEDDEPLRHLHETVLRCAGYDTDSAADGEEALAMLATDGFDLVVTDCNMPRLDGCGLVRALRARGDSIPVMMVSASLAGAGGVPAEVRCELAVTLPKPAGIRDLLDGVVRALSACPPDLRGVADAGPVRTPFARIALLCAPFNLTP